MPYLTMADAVAVLGISESKLRRLIAEDKVRAEVRDRDGKVHDWQQVNGRRKAPPDTQWWIWVEQDDMAAHERRKTAKEANPDLAELAAELARMRHQFMTAMATLEGLSHRLDEMALRATVDKAPQPRP